jgi:hypothetical protein
MFFLQFYDGVLAVVTEILGGLSLEQSEKVIAFRREITPPKAISLMRNVAKLRGFTAEFEPLSNRIFAYAANGEQSADRADF